MTKRYIIDKRDNRVFGPYVGRMGAIDGAAQMNAFVKRMANIVQPPFVAVCGHDLTDTQRDAIARHLRLPSAGFPREID